MKISQAWGSLLNQNSTLRVVLACQSLGLIILAISVVRLASLDPLIIERGNYSQLVDGSRAPHSESEIKQAIEEGLRQRFSNNAELNSSFLSPNQKSRRDDELRQLKSQRLSQFICLDNIELSKEKVIANTIRVIQAGKIPSAFLMPLEVKLETLPRSFENPYGLRISDVKEIKEAKNND